MRSLPKNRSDTTRRPGAPVRVAVQGRIRALPGTTTVQTPHPRRPGRAMVCDLSRALPGEWIRWPWPACDLVGEVLG